MLIQFIKNFRLLEKDGSIIKGFGTSGQSNWGKK